MDMTPFYQPLAQVILHNATFQQGGIGEQMAFFIIASTHFAEPFFQVDSRDFYLHVYR